MSSTPESGIFEALDECHRQTMAQLAALAEMASRMAETGLDAQVAEQAAAIEAFFSGVSRQHHADEEKTVFPPLLESADVDLVEAVQRLQQDHGWIEENWIELAPQLRAIASGYHWVDAAELGHAVQVFVDLCEGHIALEETLIYPESKARWAQALARRKARPAR
jgi:hemerythrin-like domain-containing protein